MTVRHPDGPGPFPAVVIMHDCSGLGPRSSGAPARWAKELVGRGYVVVIPDSFTPRGFPDGVCTVANTRGVDVSPERRAQDAHAALAHLRTLPEVSGKVGIMGGSHGGTTTLATMLGSRAADASGVYRTGAPLLILIGDKDDWTPAEHCATLVEKAKGAGQPVEIKIYPGAHHSFDSDRPERFVAGRINPSAPGGRGATTGGQPEAWADSIREAAVFFDRYLR